VLVGGSYKAVLWYQPSSQKPKIKFYNLPHCFHGNLEIYTSEYPLIYLQFIIFDTTDPLADIDGLHGSAKTLKAWHNIELSLLAKPRNAGVTEGENCV
jgi:hypothetical protein